MRHISVLVDEVIHYAGITPRSYIVDGTVGAGGHMRQFARVLGKHGMIVGLDRDASSLARVQAAGISSRGRIEFVHGNFTEIPAIVRNFGEARPDVIFLDLGWSMDQFADPTRGFSFSVDGPLDMRLDYPSDNQTAADIIAHYSESELADILYNLADETHARVIARALCAQRKKEPIVTTGQLAHIVAQCVPRRGKIHPATKVFQALRIEVNHELSDIANALPVLADTLAPGGRILIITFHSIEDRIVKQSMKQLEADGVMRIVTKKPVVPSADEVRANPRSRSALLRVLEKKSV